MSDKKNFSALGRIDEKYVEEADGYSVAPEARRGRSKIVAAAKAFRKERRRACRGACDRMRRGLLAEADGFPCEKRRAQ